MKKSKWGLIGVLFGAVVGTLFAPKSGKETRQDIKDAAMTAKNRAHHKLTDLQDEAEIVIAKVKKKADTLSAKAKKEVDDATKKLQATLTKAKKYISDLDEEEEVDETILETLQKELSELKSKLK